MNVKHLLHIFIEIQLWWQKRKKSYVKNSNESISKMTFKENAMNLWCGCWSNCVCATSILYKQMKTHTMLNHKSFAFLFVVFAVSEHKGKKNKSEKNERMSRMLKLEITPVSQCCCCRCCCMESMSLRARNSQCNCTWN